MTEVESARELLKENQEALASWRCRHQGYPDPIVWENCVLAALSWLWDAQERFAAEGWNSVALKGELKALGIDMPAWVSSGSPDKANSRHP